MIKMEQKYIDKFHNSYIPEPMSGCWLWTEGVRNESSFQYGYILDGTRTSSGKLFMQGAHRFSYEIHKGPIATGNQIHHKCNNTLCVNPDHLESLTPREHIMKTPGNSIYNAIHRSHCRSGHEFTKENTRYNSKGLRVCVACAEERRHRIDSLKESGDISGIRAMIAGADSEKTCPRGHTMDDANTYWYYRPEGICRACRECSRASSRKSSRDQYARNFQKVVDRFGIDAIPEKCKNGHNMRNMLAGLTSSGKIQCLACRKNFNPSRLPDGIQL